MTVRVSPSRTSSVHTAQDRLEPNPLVDVFNLDHPIPNATKMADKK